MKQIGESTISKIIVFHFKVLGLWAPENFSLAYFIYSTLLYLIFTVIYVFCMFVNFFFLTDVEETTHSLYMTLTCVALVFKTINFLWFNRDMQNNLKTVKNFELQNVDEINLVTSRLRSYKNLWLAYYMMINITGLAAYISALYTVPRQLPFRAWYPFDWRHDENTYWITYTYQVVGMIVQANLNISVEIFPGYLIYMARLKMDILSMRLERNSKNLKEQRKSIDYLVSSIKLHQHIVKFVERIEINFSIAYFAQICLSGVVICCVTYALTTTSPGESVTEYSFYLFFLVALVTQIFLPCFLGNEMIFASDDLMNSAYNSSWQEMSIGYRKLLIILMERLKRRSSILVGKLFPLSLDTFTSIIYFAYRLYAVISNTQ